VAGIDQDGVDKYDPGAYYGKAVWQDDFDISPVTHQSYLKQICNALKNESQLILGADTVVCPIVDFELFLSAKYEDFPFYASDDAAIQKQEFSAEWQSFLDSEYGLDTEVHVLSFVDDNDGIPLYAILYDTTLALDFFDVDEYTEYVDNTDTFLSGATDSCPDTLCETVFHTNLLWIFIPIINAFISSALLGVAIALPLAFVVLLISTQNWIISIFATLDVIGVMVTEFGIFYAAGYEFGSTQSLATLLIIGFSVDYVVHLANAYLESSAQSRQDRLSIALLTIGISVLSGAFTTFACGVVLCFTEVDFFQVMGLILLTTVLTSIVWAMFFFTALCAALGPENDTGDLKKYWKRWAPAKCGGKGPDSGTDKQSPKAQDMELEKISPKSANTADGAEQTTV